MNTAKVRKLHLLIVASLVAFSATPRALSAADKTEAELKAQATVSEAKAREIALAKVPGGKVKSVEIEEEDGKLVWSLDIAVAGSDDITEIFVDAKTGAIVSVEVENPEAQKKEAEEDAKKAAKKPAKHGKEDDEVGEPKKSKTGK